MIVVVSILVVWVVVLPLAVVGMAIVAARTRERRLVAAAPEEPAGAATVVHLPVTAVQR